jgi:hypothetical protein
MPFRSSEGIPEVIKLPILRLKHPHTPVQSKDYKPDMPASKRPINVAVTGNAVSQPSNPNRNKS